jgi:hypothetical protein
MKNLIILIVAFILAAIIIPVGIVFFIINGFRRKHVSYGSHLSQGFRNIALGIDILGNVVCADMLNGLFIKHGGYGFGDQGETISSALGKNQLRDTLTVAGKVLAGILDWLDEDHCINAIDSI